MSNPPTPEELQEFVLNFESEIVRPLVEKGYDQYNVFDILNISQQELRHSDFLAFLLNPRKSGYIGEQFLKYFLSTLSTILAEKNNTIADLNFFQIFYAKIENVNVYRELAITGGGFIDILIDLEIADKKIVIAIENKIYSGEHSNQLERYKDYLQKNYVDYEKMLLYLTPNGDTASSNEWTAISYTDIYTILKKVDLTTADQRLQILIQDYKTLLRRKLNVLQQNDPLVKQALEIYKNNRNIFDFIYNNKPDWVKITSSIFYDLLKKQGRTMFKANVTPINNNKGYDTLRFKTDKLIASPFSTYYFWIHIPTLTIGFNQKAETPVILDNNPSYLLKNKLTTEKMIKNFQEWVLDDVNQIKLKCQEIIDTLFNDDGILDQYLKRLEIEKQLTTENKTL